MKTTRNLSVIVLILLLLLAACCKTDSPQVETLVPVNNAGGTSGEPLTSQDPEVTAGQLPTPRPTTPAVAALSNHFPVFEGLYWTGEVGVTAAGENSARVMTGLPCSNLIDLLSAGEWRITERAVPDPSQGGMFSVMALLEKTDQVALVNLKDLSPVEIQMDGSPAPAQAAEGEPEITGCTGTIQVLPVVSLSAAGEQQAEGEAMVYPLNNGCINYGDGTEVSLLYEGPGDFRAAVTFTVPNETGEYDVYDTDFELQVTRLDKRYVALFAEAYAQASVGMEEEDEEEELLGPTFYPMSDEAGTVTVTSIHPLAGEINLIDFMGEMDTQSLHTSFLCSVQ